MKRNLLIVTFLFLSVFACCQEKKETETACSMKLKSYNGHYHIGFFSEDKNLEISFYPCGVNQLFGIAGGRYFANLGDHRQNTASNEFSSCTDWIGPYFVCGEENIKSGLSQKFTGGWHGSNGDGTGNPTASTREVKVFADGIPVSGNIELDCQKVDIHVSNIIHGYDYAVSGKDLLLETVHYAIFPGRKIEVGVTIEALEDLRIQRYYGLQSQNLPLFDSVTYMAGTKVINTGVIAAGTRCQSNKGVNTIVLEGAAKQHRLKMQMNTDEGLGTFRYLAEGLPRAFSASYRKSYFNLVNGKELILKKGRMVFWKGSYYWD